MANPRSGLHLSRSPSTMRDLPSPSISGLVRVLSSLRFWSPWIQSGPDSCSSGVLFSGILPGACSSPSGILVFPRSCSLGVQSAQNPVWLGVLPDLRFCPPLVQPDQGSSLVQALVFPGFCLVRVPVLPGSRLFRDAEWPRVLPSQDPDLPSPGLLAGF